MVQETEKMDRGNVERIMNKEAENIVKQFGYRSNAELSLADIQWLTANSLNRNNETAKITISRINLNFMAILLYFYYATTENSLLKTILLKEFTIYSRNKQHV